MSEWVTIQLKELLTLKRGYDLPHSETKSGPYPVVASTNVRGYHNEYKVDGPVITVGRSGSIGHVQYIESKAWPLNTTLYMTDAKGNNKRFIYYFLKTIGLEQFNSGAGVPTLNRNHINLLKVKIPKNTIQTKIADVLSTYDKLIENNNCRIQILEKNAEELYKEWFVRMRFPGYEKTKFDKGIPEGWEVRRIKDLGELITGKTPPTNDEENYGGEVMFVKTPDMNGNLFTIETESYLSNKGNDSQPKKLIPEGSIMVSCIGTGGVVSINGYPAHTNQQINSIILNKSLEREWAYFTLHSMKGTIELFGATGATMTNLSKGKFENLKILYPINDLVLRYHTLTKGIFSKIKNLNIQNQNLKKQRDLLLPRLMNGTIIVK